MTSTTKDAVRSALLEAGFVVLGVILALAANEWRQDLADKEHSRQAVASIQEEVRANRAAVEVSMEYHSELLKMLQGEHEEGWVPDARDFPRGFIFPARVSRTAWSTASETGALSKTEFSVVMKMSRIYALQDRYEAQVLTVGQIIYAELFKGGTQAIAGNYRNLASIISTFAYREKELLAQYDETMGPSDVP